MKVTNVDTFTILSLCTGIGGLELGLKLAFPNARTICYCEREATCIEILVKRIKEGILDNAPIWSDITTFDGKPWNNKVDCIIGGYPCQPFSSIGNKLGEKDHRWLWKDIARIIREVEPGWCFFENVSAHLRMGFEQVHNDLQEMDYKIASGVFAAAEVGASHKRERLFFWPTPSASDGSGRLKESMHTWITRRIRQKATNPKLGDLHLPLTMAVKLWLLAQKMTHQWTWASLPNLIVQHGKMNVNSTQLLNPLFVEKLMGFPCGWTDCDAAVMEWFHLWQRIHSMYLHKLFE